MINLEDIIALARAGYNAQQIGQMAQLSNAPQPAPQPVPQPAPQPTPQPAPQPTPQPAPQPTPQPAPQPAYTPILPGKDYLAEAMERAKAAQINSALAQPASNVSIESIIQQSMGYPQEGGTN